MTTLTVKRCGAPFTVEDDSSTSHWNFWKIWADEVWEPEALRLAEEFTPRDGVFLDIGAWVGPFALWVGRIPTRRVVALEPDPSAFATLALNVLHNRLAENVRIHPKAAALAAGEAMLYSVADAFGQSTSSLTHPLGTARAVPTLDVCALVRTIAPDFVKIDIEGGEALIFPALGPLLRDRQRPVLLSLHGGQYGDDPHAADALYEELDNWRMRRLAGAGESFLLLPG